MDDVTIFICVGAFILYSIVLYNIAYARGDNRNHEWLQRRSDAYEKDAKRYYDEKKSLEWERDCTVRDLRYQIEQEREKNALARKYCGF